MQKIAKKLAFIACAGALMLPLGVQAQESTESQDTSDNAAENAQPQSPSADSADGQNNDEAAPTAAETTPAPVETKPRDIPGNVISSSKSSREARKEAMRTLSNSYPVDAVETQDATPAPIQAADSPISPRVIPAGAKVSERMPHFEHHGYFRTRLSAFGNYDLNTRGTSPVAAPLDAKERGATQQENIKKDDSDAVLGGDMRFRYEPTLHISETIRVSATLDILDNLVLGTTPNKLRTNWGSDTFFTFNGAEPANGDTIGRNAISVKALYGEADTMLGTFRAGRVPTHWGMGIIYNDGGRFNRETEIIDGHAWQCLSCDSSDAVDKIEYRLRDPFFDVLYLMFSWDFVNSGLASYNLQQDSLGQAFDLTDTDDVLQFTLSVFDRPLSQQEIDERFRRLYELREWDFDWGVMFSYRDQTIAAEVDAQQNGDGAAATYDLYEKNATAYMFDLWGRVYLPMPKEVMLRLETEIVGVFGSVDLDSGNEGESRDIAQVGFAFEGAVTWRDLNTGLRTGVAWADNTVYSGHSMIEDLSIVPMGSIMRFDPNYRIDEIMFHELMDGINNAWYMNIYGEYKFPVRLAQMTTALGARVDFSTAMAIEKSATPGNGSWYGFEGNAKLYYEETDRFKVEIGAGFFAPGKAWKHLNRSSYPILPSQSVYEESTTKSYDPDVAWNVQTNLYFMF
jgi:uncharacterized protein (TIGR04551 family)